MSRDKLVSSVLLLAVVAVLANGATAGAAPPLLKDLKPKLIQMATQPPSMPEHQAVALLSRATLEANNTFSPSGGPDDSGSGTVDTGPAAGINVRTDGRAGTQSEISMAATAGGQNIVITYNGGPSGLGFESSQNGGRTFSAPASPPNPAGSNPCCDPSTVGDAGSNFYMLQLFRDDGANTPNAGNCTNSLHVSTDGGQNFSSIVSSPFSYPPNTVDFPDQPHIAVDRNNFVGGQRQLYVTTRHFTSGINCPQSGGGGTVQGEIVCSNDGGATWSNALVWPTFTDTAHIGVAPDGRVYVAGMGIGTNANTSRVLLWRSASSGATGCPGAGNTMTFTGPTVVADNLTFGQVVDREFPQPDVIVDPTNSQRVYISYSADDTQGSGDREAFLTRCDFALAVGTCQAPVTLNDNPVDGTDQYFPMTCVDPVSNAIHASWNDARLGTNHQIRSATVTNNGTTVSASRQVSDATWPIVNFGGAPDYGDYNENNGACRANHHYAAWTSQVSPAGITPASTDPDVFFAVVNDAPVAEADGPYTTAEGTDVALNGSATDTENDTPFTFEWDFDDDSQFDDATGQTPNFTKVGQDGSFPVCLRVTDSVGDSTTDCSTVTVTNVAPSVSLGADDPKGEGATLSVSGSISDPGWLDNLSGTIDWGDGSPAEPLSGTLENGRPNATLSYDATHIYGDNGLYPVQVCGADDDTSTCDSISVQIDNVAPAVTKDAGQDVLIDEGDVLSALFAFSDPGWLDTYTSSVSWGYIGFASETGALTVDPDDPPNPDTGTLSASKQYGDNGTFTVTGTVNDDDAGTDSDNFDVIVNNVNPTATIDTAGATDINGNSTFIAHAGEIVPFSGNSTDPGSDDLFLSWDWDDGAPAPDVSTAYLRNSPFFDLDPSPEVGARDVDDSKSHLFGDACLYDVVFSSADDDDGSAADDVAVIIQGNGTRRKSEGYWKNQYAGSGAQDFSNAELQCYLEITAYISNIFNEESDVSTFALATKTLSPHKIAEKQLERALLSALLNFANGAVEYDQVLGGASFSTAITDAEATLLDPTSTDAELHEHVKILERFSRQ